METRPPLDSLAAEYVALGFAIERHVPGYVDAYVGPPEFRAPTTETDVEPMELLARVERLARFAGEAQIEDTRVGYLTAQIQGMLATCRRLAGESLTYVEEVHRCFDVEPERTPESTFETAAATLDELLPGSGSIGERMAAWRRRFEIAPETARDLIATIVPELRERTLTITDLPPGEHVEFQMVQNQPWSGYNWFLGDATSRVDLNTDLPIHANTLVGLLCHEAYPGHHTEHSLKERVLYHERGYGEHAIQLINTPECVISEGIATLAEGAIFPGDDLARFHARQVFPAAGLAALASEAERDAAIGQAQQELRAVAGNAALLLHADGAPEADVVSYLMRYGLRTEQEARQRLRFLTDPLWRPYVFTYHAGYDLLGAWLSAAVDDAERATRFRTLLTEQIYPGRVQGWLAEDVN